MASAYPAALDTTATLPSAGAVGANLSTFPHSALTGNVNDAVIAIETELGTAPSGTDTTVKARLDRITPTLGAANTWAPAVTQPGSVTVTNVRSTWTRVGRIWTMRFQLTVTGTGTANNPVVIGNFGTTVGSHPSIIGSCALTDVSASLVYIGVLSLASTTTMNLLGTSANADARMGVTGAGTFAAGLAVGDILSGTFIFEAGAD